MTNWPTTPATQATPKQRAALYRFLIRDPDHVKQTIRSLSVDQAAAVLSILVAATSQTDDEKEKGVWQRVE